jgi:HPt (histidine-containing phosphotransfer) domain-containing protein
MARRDITGAVDFDYLEAYAAGDLALVEEVLAIFREQAALWTPLMDPHAPAEGWRDAVHTLKGAGRGVGAFALGAACEAAEAAEEGAVAARLGDVRHALDLALADIAAYAHERALRSLRSTA